MNGRLGVYPAASGNPEVGRFLSPDPFIQDPGATQSYDRYAYCRNNPTSFTDPSGYIMYTAPQDDIRGDISGWFSGGRTGGAGGCGPSYGDNGTGLNGVYYDWNSGTYRSTITGEEVGYLHTYYNSIVPYTNTYYQQVDAYAGSDNDMQYKYTILKMSHNEVPAGVGGNYQGAGMVNNISFLIDGTTTITIKFLVNEYKLGGDVVDIMKGVKTVSKIGKVSTALNVGAVGYDIVSGNVQSSTVADAAMIVGGVIIGVAIGPITAGVVGIVYGGAMIMGWQDAINNAFNGNWNLQLNKTINNIYGK